MDVWNDDINRSFQTGQGVWEELRHEQAVGGMCWDTAKPFFPEAEELFATEHHGSQMQDLQ